MTKTQSEMAAHDETTWKLYNECSEAAARVTQYATMIRRSEAALNDERFHVRMSVRADDLDALREELAKREAAQTAAIAALDEHETAYTGWSRFWCVPNGHIHSSRRCSTCNHNGKLTAFFLAHEVSGMDEAAAVAAQGPVLCTVCFPTAPLDWTNGLDEAAKAKQAAQCSGSGAYDYEKAPTFKRSDYHRRYQRCPHCAQMVSITSLGKMRAHKPAKKS